MGFAIGSGSGVGRCSSGSFGSMLLVGPTDCSCASPFSCCGAAGG